MTGKYMTYIYENEWLMCENEQPNAKFKADNTSQGAFEIWRFFFKV